MGQCWQFISEVKYFSFQKECVVYNLSFIYYYLIFRAWLDQTWRPSSPWKAKHNKQHSSAVLTQWYRFLSSVQLHPEVESVDGHILVLCTSQTC